MKLLEFIKNYKTYIDENTFDKHFKLLLKESKKSDILLLCFQTLLEEGEISFRYLKELIEYDEKGKEDILNDSNTFKWACAFGHPYLVLYLNDIVKDHNLPGAINATFMQYRLDNLKVLEVLGYEKQIYTEPNLCQAISRANQHGCSLSIVEHFFNNFEKFPKLSSYVDKELEKQEWVNKICSYEYEKTLEVFLNMKSEKFNEKLIDKAGDIIGGALNEKNVKLLDCIMSSYLKKDFITKYNKIKATHLKQTLSLDENNNFDYLVTTYPELIEHKDIKLWMMNYRSLTIDKIILEKRAFTQEEIKKSYLQLSQEEDCFTKLLKITPNFNYAKFKIQEVIKIVNNNYEAKKYNNEIDYSYDNEYMSFNRKILLSHKDFKQYVEEIREVINDRKMFDLLYKEQIKNNLETRLPPKIKTKQSKI